MITKQVMVTNQQGLHARPATILVKKASLFKSEITIEFNGKKANMKSLIGILSLGVIKDCEVIVSADGVDEALAIDEIINVITTLEG